MMSQLQKIIEVLLVIYIGLRFNIFSHKIIVSYADQIIYSEKNPDSLFIDISLSSKSKNEVIHHLHYYIEQNKNQIDPIRVLSVLSVLKTQRIINLESIIILMNGLNIELDFNGFEKNEICRLEDQYHLVSNKYVMQTMEELDAEISSFLNNYSMKTEILSIFK